VILISCICFVYICFWSDSQYWSTWIENNALATMLNWSVKH